jgi:hypothetical protein
MTLSHDEELFLRHWMYDEWHFKERQGPAKRLQLEHKAISGDLATLIAAAMPDPSEQLRAGEGPPPAEPPVWPWSGDSCMRRVEEARRLLGVPAPKSRVAAE